MADILRITTPVVNKNQLQANRPVADNILPFNPQELSKVVKPNPHGEMLKQNNGMIEKEQASTILMNLLKDPSVTVNFLKNIYLLQEVIKLLSVNNTTVTQEIEQLFDSLLVKPEEIVPEMIRQENTSTAFKGEIFNFLRTLVAADPTPEMKYAVANVLKSINGTTGRQSIMEAIANSLSFLSDSVDASKSLSGRLHELSQQLRSPDSQPMFHELKTEVLKILNEVEGSILFSDKLAKVVSITHYNLSRFNDNPDFFHEAVSNLLLLLDGKDQKGKFMAAVRDFTEKHDFSRTNEDTSKIMDVLAKIIGKESENSSRSIMTSEKVEKIIQSLLSSPCNFTPLLHFVVPVEYLDLKSFAEIWVNPDGSQDMNEGGGGEKKLHMLIVFDIEGMGQFEVELFVSGKTVDFALLCPPAYADAFAAARGKFARSIAGTSYQLGDIKIDKLERSRSLMDVFKSLPRKRTGVDVKV